MTTTQAPRTATTPAQVWSFIQQGIFLPTSLLAMVTLWLGPAGWVHYQLGTHLDRIEEDVADIKDDVAEIRQSLARIEGKLDIPLSEPTQ